MRRHGCELPLHPLQVAVVAAFLALGFAFYIFFVPFVECSILKNFGLVVYSLLILAVCGLYIGCVTSNPADVQAMSLRKDTHAVLRVEPLAVGNGQANSLSTDRFPRIYDCVWNTCIQIPTAEDMSPSDRSFFCSFCNVMISLDTKHCLVCDKCVNGFDHHCRWLNNCIGKKNHKAFIILIVAALFMFTMQWSFGIWIIVRWFLGEREYGRIIFLKLGRSFPSSGYLLVLIFCTLVAMVATYLLGQGIIFHDVLMKKGVIMLRSSGAKRTQADIPERAYGPKALVMPDTTINAAGSVQQQQNSEPMSFIDQHQGASSSKQDKDLGGSWKALSQRFSTKKVCIKINPWSSVLAHESEDLECTASMQVPSAVSSLSISEEMNTRDCTSHDLTMDLAASHGVDSASRRFSEVRFGCVDKLILSSWQNGKLPFETTEHLDSSENDSGTLSHSVLTDHALDPLQREARNVFKSSHSFSSVLRPKSRCTSF